MTETKAKRPKPPNPCYAKVREDDPDTVDVTYNGTVLLVFSANMEVIQNDDRCWLAVQRTPEGIGKTIREFLLQAWPSAWNDFEAPADLIWEGEAH